MEIGNNLLAAIICVALVVGTVLIVWFAARKEK